MNNDTSKKKNMVLVFLTEFIRIRGVVTWSTVSFIGFILGMSSLELSCYMVPLLTFVVSTFCILSFTFAINNYYDAESDRENPRRIHINAIASEKISKQTSIFLNTAFVIIPLVISMVFKQEVFFFCVLLLIWMWVYSSPPLRLKGRPGVDVLWHFVAFVLLLLWGSLIAGSIALINWLIAISFGIWSLIAQVWNHISDYSFDKDSGTVTFAVWMGIDTAKTVLKMIVLIHMIFLIPLLVLYSLSYLLTIVILIGGAVIVLVGVKSKKDFPVSPAYYIPFLFAGVVYLNCVIYHISKLLGL
jgi:4-hydroxybenzoate polyprenyltransferase